MKKLRHFVLPQSLGLQGVSCPGHLPIKISWVPVREFSGDIQICESQFCWLFLS